MKDKPAYNVPSMPEITSIPWNGFNVVSTFSGCGGSCLGYRMAGYRVLWANEFVPAAQQSYRANFADSILDPRDIRKIQPGEILQAISLKEGELDLLDGSPPCQAFSTAGKRHKGWGQKKRYEHGAEQCNEDLFAEYVRLLRGLMPRAFVAENVSGLVKGTCKGYFLEILKALKDCGYRVRAKVLDAQWLGVPQMRQRLIFIGVRNDLKTEPAFPKPLPYRYSVREAIPWIAKWKEDRGFDGHRMMSSDRPMGTITKTGIGNLVEIEGANGFNGHAGQPADQPMAIVQAGTPVRITQQQGAAGIGKKQISSELPLPTVCSSQDQQFIIEPARHLPPSRLRNGAYAATYVDLKLPCPTVTIASPGNDLAISEDARPCRAVTTDDSFGSRGIVKRKFSIAELKRICAFPDDFILTGTYAQQWARLGNAVPPLMARAVADVIRDQILKSAS